MSPHIPLRKLLKTFAATLCILIFAAFFLKSLNLNPNQLQSPLVGKSAEVFHVKMLQGATDLLGHKQSFTSLEDLRGKPVLINFWSSWCGSCAQESHELEKFWSKHGEKVKILAIAVHDDEQSVLEAVKSLGKTYPVALDESGKIALNYGVTGVPETLLIDEKGVIIHKEMGPVNHKQLEELIRNFESQT